MRQLSHQVTAGLRFLEGYVDLSVPLRLVQVLWCVTFFEILNNVRMPVLVLVTEHNDSILIIFGIAIDAADINAELEKLKHSSAFPPE